MPEITLESVGRTVNELQVELKSARPDQEKVARMNEFLTTYEEKVAQPILLAQKAQEGMQSDLAELKEQMLAAGETETKAQERIDGLEVELAARVAHATAENPEAYKDSPEYKAFYTHVRVGEKRMEYQDGIIQMTEEQKALLRTDINADGGYLVPIEMDSALVKTITELDPIRAISRVRTIAGKAITLPKRTSIPVAVFESENEEGTDSTSGYESEMVTPFRQTFTTPITIDLLGDAAFNMEAEIMSDAAEAFAFGEGQNFVTGSGDKQPEGFITNAALVAAARSSGLAADIAIENLIDLSADLKVGYDPIFVMNRRTLARIRKFRTENHTAGVETGSFLWGPGLGGPAQQTILGFPYILANSMPDIGADAFPIAFGDFRRAYTIIDRSALAVIRDDFSLKKKAAVEFTMHRWVTGQVTLTEPIKLLKCET